MEREKDPNLNENSLNTGEHVIPKIVEAESIAEMEQTQESKQFDMREFLRTKKGYVDTLLKIVYKIFHKHANVNVIKVGLVYLAKITNYFESLCERYLEVLLSANETIRITVLNTEEKYNKPMHLIQSKCYFLFDFFINYSLILGTNTYKYLQTGAPKYWNSGGLAMALNDYVKAEESVAFELKHIDILASCLVQTIQPDQKEIWLKIYTDLQKYIFVALTDEYHCKLASGIIERIFINKDLKEKVLEVR